MGVVSAMVVLGIIGTLTVTTVLNTGRRLDSVGASRELSSAYTDMALAIGQAQIHNSRYRETGDRKELSEEISWISLALNADERVKQYGTPEDVKFMTDLEARYGQELAAGLSVIGGADPNSPNFFTVDPDTLDGLLAQLAAPTSRSRDNTDERLASLRESFNDNSTSILAAIAIGMPLLGLLFFMINRYERKDAIKAAELERLGQAALTDSLTGLGNHRAFQEELRREVARAGRRQSPISIVMIDVDDFKEINDSLGHAHGDSVLTNVGGLMAYLRSADRAFRIGGDEFALIMPDTDATDAHIALERLRRSVPQAVPGVTISTGFCTSERGEETATLLRDEADSALYEAKHRGKNQVVRYNQELDANNELTATKMSALRQVLASGNPTMWFQPIFRFGTEQLLAFEALLRLPGIAGLDGPEDAFAVAQHMGRSRDLDMMCAASALRSAPALPPGAKIFINLDPATLIHAEFTPEDLAHLVEDAGVQRSDVVFEVTEKTNTPLPRLIKQIAAIRALGFAVALDDVGAGNSGLEMLRLAPFDYVKIDRSVVMDAMDGGPGRAIILAIVAFARETASFMIAEGIESQEMLEAVKLDADGLRRFWIQGVQGFLFGEPRPNLEPSVRARGISAA